MKQVFQKTTILIAVQPHVNVAAELAQRKIVEATIINDAEIRELVRKFKQFRLSGGTLVIKVPQNIAEEVIGLVVPRKSLLEELPRVSAALTRGAGIWVTRPASQSKTKTSISATAAVVIHKLAA